MHIAQYDTRDDEKDGSEASSHAAAEEGKIDVVKSLLEQCINEAGKWIHVICGCGRMMMENRMPTLPYVRVD